MAAVWLGLRGDASAASPASERAANTPPAPALDPKEFRPFTLLRVQPLTRDTARYTFALPRESDELGMTVAGCLVVKAGAEANGKEVMRPYTPTSPAQPGGTFDLVGKADPGGEGGGGGQ